MSDATESRQIETLRVMCITSMMWVHVNPGTSTLSVVNGGEFAGLGWFLADVLGRSSVSTLSFISGYLLWKGHLQRTFGQLVVRQFGNIVVPMIFWGSIFLALLLIKDLLVGDSTSLALIDRSLLGYLDAVFGISGGTANQSLFFLRDLFVSSVILRLLLPAIRRAPILTVAIVTMVAVGGPFEPVLFRPSILLFLTLGAVVARCGQSIERLSALRVALPSAIVVAACSVLVALLASGAPAASPEIAGILRRLGLTLLALALSGALVRLMRFTALAWIGRHMYLGYLAHVPVIGIFWTVWTSAVGGPLDDSYVVFFLFAPPVSVALATSLGTMLDYAPPAAQRLLRGKVCSPGRGRAGEGLPQVALSS